MQVLYSVCVVSVLWFAVGYSLAFTDGPLVALIGGLGKAFLAGVTPASTVETFTKGVVIPEYAFAMFQMSFAAITPALIVGSFAERVRFPAVAAFIPLWSLLVYLPIAHMVWFWGGPSDPTGPSGFIFSLGALDFAGGTVVHINAGIAGLVGALFVGRRIGYGRDHMPPHALTMTFIGAALLWVGWFGFNAGSALEVGGTALLAMLNTFLATAAAALSWIAVEWTFRGKASLLGGLSGAIAGLVAVTPAAGFAGPGGALALGLAAGAFCFYCCTGLKNRFGYDDTLDVFGIHCTGGVLGAIATGVLAWPALGGSGVWDYATDSVGAFDPLSQVTAQALAVCITLLWSGSLSYLLFLAIDRTLGLRVSKDQEREGLDLADHGERAYNY
jgi:Amt family ammonium transporter